VTVVLVTVAGPSGRRDLAVPADVPVGDLLGQVAAALPGADPAAAAADGPPGRPRQARWRLATLGGDPLPPDRSLAACGIGHGATLTLTLDPPPAPGAATTAAAQSRRCAVVGVVSAGAGTGRTTVAALLAAVLAATREGATVAVDAHPGPGSLTGRLAPGHDAPAGDLLGLLDHPDLGGGELLACLAGPRPAGPAVVGVGGSRAPGRRAWRLLVEGLARRADALVLDCGPGLADPGARAALATADQLVLVTEPAPSPGSRRVAGALTDLGHAVVVVAAGTGSGGAGQAELARLLPGVRGVVPLPPPAATPPREWAEVPPWWRRPALELASLLAADWPALGVAAGG
jgi:Mrp family chromosome partitioning ATPase